MVKEIKSLISLQLHFFFADASFNLHSSNYKPYNKQFAHTRHHLIYYTCSHKRQR